MLSVTVVDVDDNPPQFEQDQYTASVPENSPHDQVVLQTRVTDLDMVPSRPMRKNTDTQLIKNIFIDIYSYLHINIIHIIIN